MCVWDIPSEKDISIYKEHKVRLYIPSLETYLVKPTSLSIRNTRYGYIYQVWVISKI